MEVPQEQGQADINSSRTGIVAAILLFLLVVSIAFYTYIKSINPLLSLKDFPGMLKGTADDGGNEVRILYSYGFESRTMPIFTTYNGYLVKCNDGGIWLLDKKGGIVRSESTGFSKPIIKVSGSRLMAADTGTGDIVVFNDKSVSWKEKLDTSIINADIAKNGSVTLVTSSKRDKNEVRVYDSLGVELLRKVIAKNHVLSAGVSPSGKKLTVSEIGLETVRPYSVYRFFNLEGKEIEGRGIKGGGDIPLQDADMEDELMPIFWYNNDDSLFVAGDSCLAYFDKEGELAWRIQFNTVFGASLTGDGQLAVVANDGKGNRLILLNREGQENAAVVLEETPTGLAAIKGMMAVSGRNEVCFYNEKCKLIGRFAAETGIRQVCIFSKQQAAIITDGKISIISII